MGKPASNLVQGLVRFTNKSLVKNLIVITLCVMFVFIMLFYPYDYYVSAKGNSNSSFQVGIHYVYEQDNLGDVYWQVAQIHNVGFKVIRVTSRHTSTTITTRKQIRYFKPRTTMDWLWPL